MLKIGTLNCRGLRDVEKQTDLAKDLESYDLDILCLQETHLEGSGTLNIKTSKNESYDFMFSGSNSDNSKNSWSGVAIVIKEKFKSTFTPISDRLCFASFRDDKGKVFNIISAHAYSLPRS